MRSTCILFPGVVAAVTAAFATSPAQANVRVVPYAKVGSWTVRAVYAASGPFDHCSANARYQTGTRVSLIVYRSGGWRLWFAHEAWPDRGRATFPARVEVDGRVVLNQNGNYRGKNAYVDLGRETSRVVALMRGRAMAIVTPNGTSRFSLNGTNQATRALAGCWKVHYQANPGVGAFGSANNSATGGAFGGGNVTSGSSSSVEVSRANTLEIAASYLSKSAQAYSILPADKAPLKHFPVNWKFQDGSIGGMRVFQNTNVAVDKLLGTLLSDQAKHCQRRNASEREPLKTVEGRRMVRARGVCETAKGKVLNITYKVAELGRRTVMMVMELRAAGAPASSGGTAAKPPAPQSGAGGAIDQGLRVPGPNEL